MDMHETTAQDDELVRGAREIAEVVFGGKLTERQVYRLFEKDPSWPVFKLLGQWAGYVGRLRAEIRRRSHGSGQ